MDPGCPWNGESMFQESKRKKKTAVEMAMQLQGGTTIRFNDMATYTN